ncbi:MAG: hypothetical protein J0M12_00430 [Deltaproteobacteria bacterium]|nr:hypothetical protein [Deltaproteobacteria bacterium]
MGENIVILLNNTDMTTQAPNKFLSPVGFQDILVLLALHSLVAVQLVGFADDPGLGWHLAAGHWSISHASVPTSDPFLALETARPWISTQWLSDVLLWSLYNLGSWPLLYSFFTIVFAFTFLGLLYRTLTQVSGSYLLSSLALIVAFKIAQVHFILRPVVFGFFFFVLVFGYVAKMYRSTQSGEETSASLRRMFFLLPLLFVAWANLHPTFPLGLLLVALLPVGVWLDRFSGLRKSLSTEVSIRALFLLLGVCVLATLCNPYGYRLHEEVFLQFGNFAATHFEEWAPVDFRRLEGQLFQFSIAMVLLGFFLESSLRARIGWFGILSILVFGHLGASVLRCVPYFGIVVSLPLVYAFQTLGSSELLARIPRAEWYLEKLSLLESREKRSLHGYAVLSAVLLLLLVDCTANRKLLLYEGPFGPSFDRFPYAALDVVKETSLSEGQIVIAAPLAWGGFITLYGEGSMKAIIDDRGTMIGDDFYNAYYDALKVGSDWMTYLSERGANRLLLPANDPLAIFIKQTGEALPLFEDSHSILFELPSQR